MPKTQEPSINLSLRLDDQPSVAAILAEMADLKGELTLAQRTLSEAETAKKVTFQRTIDTYGHPDDQGESLAMREADHAITLAWRTVRDVQSRLADCEYRLSVERAKVRAEMAQNVRELLRGPLLALADLLEAVDARWQYAAEVLGAVAMKFPAGQAPISPELLRGSNAQVSQKIRRVLAQQQ